MSAIKFQIKRSSVAGKTPSATDLDVGELAINLNDGRLFTKNGSNSVVDAVGQNVNTSANVIFAEGSFTGNVDITGSLTINGHSSHSFGKINTVLANTSNDTLSFVGGPGVTITSSNTAKTITIEVAQSGNGTIVEFSDLITSNNDLVYSVANTVTDDDTFVAINGIVQSGGYTLSGNTVTFDAALPSGASVNVVKLADGGGTPFTSVETITSNGASIYTLLSSAKSTTTIVAVDGVIQRNSVDYTASGTTLTWLDEYPPAGSEITIFTTRSSFVRSPFTGNGVANTFATSKDLSTTTSIVVLGGLIQRYVTDYSFSGTEVVFTEPVIDGMGGHVLTFAAGVKTIEKQSITGNGSNTYTLNISTDMDSILVYVEGMYQHPVEDYLVVGGTSLRFTNPIDVDDRIRIRYINTD